MTRVGGSEPIKVDVRIIAATNRRSEEAVAAGKLREDLLYRLNVFPIQLPPLRERGDDVELLAEHFLSELNAGGGHGQAVHARRACERLRRHTWPGNVRELKNVVQRAFILAEDDIGVDSLPASGVAEELGSSEPGDAGRHVDRRGGAPPDPGDARALRAATRGRRPRSWGSA